MKIVIDNKIPFLKGVFEPFAEVKYFPGKEITAEKVKEADALIIRTRTICNEELLLGSKVKYIASATIGFDHIDAKYCKENNIEWTNAPGCNSGSVMQYIASVLVRLSEKHKFKFSDKIIGIIGVGNVGSKVAKMAKTLGFNVLLNDPPRERKEGKGGFVSLEEIKQNADIITFHVPLNRDGENKTFHMFNEDFLAELKQDVIIINSSRGEVIDEVILKQGLKSGHVKSAVLDVWENEPDIDLELLKLVDIATPHIAGYSLDGKANGTKMVVQAVSKFFELGLDNWQPKISDKIENWSFEIEYNHKADEQIFKEIILNTYDVLQDDERFRMSPQMFEEQRNNYPIRREFEYYISQNSKLSEKAKFLLESLQA